MKRELLAIIAIASLAGCTMGGGVETKKVAFVLPSGWAKAESDDQNVTIAVPPGFRQGTPNMFSMTGMLEGMNTPSNDPSTAQMSAEDKKALESFSQGMDRMSKEDEMRNLDNLKKKKGIILHCISTAKPVPGDEQTRFYVKKKSQSGNWTWPDTDASEQDCFLNKQVATEVKLPIGLAHRMQATWQKQDGSSYTQISYLVPSGRDLYVLRLITVESPEVITTNEKEVANSLRIN